MKSWVAAGARSGNSALRIRLREELRDKLRDYAFTHFVTLASNHRPLSPSRMRALLKQWDARVNHDLNGPRWHRRPDERLVWFAFPEKIDGNPHWHLVVEPDPVVRSEARAKRYERLPEIGAKHWLTLLRQGSFDCQRVDSKRVINYVTKMSATETHFESFIVFSEFMHS